MCISRNRLPTDAILLRIWIGGPHKLISICVIRIGRQIERQTINSLRMRRILLSDKEMWAVYKEALPFLFFAVARIFATK
jgi:hypothetical protein